MLSMFLKVAIATSNFMKEVYNGWFLPELSVTMLKETIAIVWEYVYETMKWKAKLAEWVKQIYLSVYWQT